MANEIFYDFEHDGERMVLEFTDEKKVCEWADEWFAARFDDEEMRNGETREDEGYIIKYSTDDDGEETIIERKKHELYYEYYHGDFAEHNTHYGL